MISIVFFFTRRGCAYVFRDVQYVISLVSREQCIAKVLYKIETPCVRDRVLVPRDYHVATPYLPFPHWQPFRKIGSKLYSTVQKLPKHSVFLSAILYSHIPIQYAPLILTSPRLSLPSNLPLEPFGV